MVLELTKRTKVEDSSTMGLHTNNSDDWLYEKDSNQASASRSRGGVDVASW